MDAPLNPYPGADQLLKGATGFDVEQDNWGNLDFSTGRIDYTDDDHEAIQTLLDPPRKIIGTSGLASCTGVVILIRTRVVVGHYTGSYIEDGSKPDELSENSLVRYFLKNQMDLMHGRAWIIHCGTEAPVTEGAAMNEHDNGRRLYATLRKILGMPKEMIAVLKYNAPLETEPAGSIMVDGRNSPNQMATVHAQGFKELQAYTVNP